MRLLILLLSPILLNAQATNQPRFTVAGSVVNSVTGEPIRRALVQISGPEQHSAFTGGDGRFEIEGVVQGQFYANAQKPGFFDFRSLGNFAAPIKVSADTESILFKLVPEASIEGRIVDNDGEAIEGLLIQCLEQIIENGRTMRQSMATAKTDGNGIFHIDSLRPGSYFIETQQQELFPGSFNQSTNSTLAQQVYPRHYYPNTAETSSAQPLVLRPGEKARADFTIAPLRAFQVSGSVSPAQNIFGTLETADGQQLGMAVNVDARTEHWTIPAIPSGSWTLVFRTQNPQGESFYAEQPLNVTSSDVQNVQVILQPLAAIPVSVVGGSGNGPPQVQVQLIPEGTSRWQGGRFAAASPRENPQAPPTLRGMPPGSYSVVAFSNGPNLCVAALSSGSIDLTRNLLEIAGGSEPQPIEVTLGDNCGTIQGNVHSEDQSAAGTVILLPSSHAMEPRTAAIRNDGSFAFSGLNPGDYRVYAFSNVAGLEYGNPDALREASGEQVSLAPKQSARVNLTLIVREGN